MRWLLYRVTAIERDIFLIFWLQTVCRWKTVGTILVSVN